MRFRVGVQVETMDTKSSTSEFQTNLKKYQILSLSLPIPEIVAFDDMRNAFATNQNA